VAGELQVGAGAVTVCCAQDSAHRPHNTRGAGRCWSWPSTRLTSAGASAARCWRTRSQPTSACRWGLGLAPLRALAAS
jgi:hypothetical protein